MKHWGKIEKEWEKQSHFICSLKSWEEDHKEGEGNYILKGVLKPMKLKHWPYEGNGERKWHQNWGLLSTFPAHQNKKSDGSRPRSEEHPSLCSAEGPQGWISCLLLVRSEPSTLYLNCAAERELVFPPTFSEPLLTASHGPSISFPHYLYSVCVHLVTQSCPTLWFHGQ